MSAVSKDPSEQIPNRFLFLWAGRNFPYTNRLAIESVLLADPEALVEVYIFGNGEEANEHYEWVEGYERVSVRSVDPETAFEGLDAPVEEYAALLRAIPRRAYSARSNLIRYGLLNAKGGIYLDFDVLVVRDFRHLLHLPAFIGEERVWKVDEARVEGRVEPWMALPTAAYVVDYGLRWLDARLLGGRGLVEPVARRLDSAWSTGNLNNAVIGATPKNPFIRRVLAASLEASPSIRYHLGPTLVSRVYRETPEDVVIMPPEVFFIQPPSYSFRFFYGAPFELPAETVLIHYVSSNHNRLLQQMTPERVEERRGQALFYEIAFDVAQRAWELPRRSGSAR